MEALLPPVRFLLLRIVMVGGMKAWPEAESLLGEARGGVEVGAGSFDRAELTRCSSFCILPISPRIWCKEPDAGRPPPAWELAGRLMVERRDTYGVGWLLRDIDGPRI